MEAVGNCSGLRLYYKGEKMEAGHMPDASFHGYRALITERLSEIIPRHEDVRVLDIGTGMASTAKFLLQHLSKRSKVWSLDPSEEILSKARAALTPENQKRIRFLQGSADALEFEDESFDIVVSVMVLHHIEQVGKSIAEMARVLRRGGRLIIVDYSPEAHVLDFHSRHTKGDFVKPSAVSKAMKGANLKPRVETHDKWYLVEATRPATIE
jgi:ubiquinone/menaquinone biosynthesis C-methylase UbiE